MSNMPLVSIVVPVFNSAHLVGSGIRSFLSQSMGDFEVLIIDNASDDNVVALVESFDDCRLRYIRNDSNIGMINNFNRGLVFARGKYITLISSDEMMLGTDSLARRVDLLESNSSIDFVWCAYDNILPDGSTYSWDQDLPNKEVMTSAEALSILMLGSARGFRITTVVMRRSILEANGYRIPLIHSGDMVMCAEWLLWSRNAACVREIIHRNIIHSTHRHDFFGSSNPFLGERDWLMLKFLDEHSARIIAMGLPLYSFERVILTRLTKLVFQKIPTQGFSRFWFYFVFALNRWVRFLLLKSLSPFVYFLFLVCAFLLQSYEFLRINLSRASYLRRLLGKDPLD